MTPLTAPELFKIAEPTYKACGMPVAIVPDMNDVPFPCELRYFPDQPDDEQWAWSYGAKNDPWCDVGDACATALHAWYWVQWLNKRGAWLEPMRDKSGWTLRTNDDACYGAFPFFNAPTNLEALALAVVIVHEQGKGGAT